MIDDAPPTNQHDEVEQLLKAVLDDAATPAWVRALLSLVMLLASDLRAENARLRHQLYGRKSERIRTPRKQKLDSEKKQAVRGTTSKKAPLETVNLDVALELDACPCCGGTDLADCGVEQTEQVERIPERLVRRQIRRQKKVCRSCETITTAPAPPAVKAAGRNAGLPAGRRSTRAPALKAGAQGGSRHDEVGPGLQRGDDAHRAYASGLPRPRPTQVRRGAPDRTRPSRMGRRAHQRDLPLRSRSPRRRGARHARTREGPAGAHSSDDGVPRPMDAWADRRPAQVAARQSDRVRDEAVANTDRTARRPDAGA